MSKIYSIDEYYKLKKRYENSIKKMKSKIIKDQGLSKTQKKTMFNAIQEKIQCIHCKNKGGTLFESTESTLIIQCGSKKKCKLNISIPRTKTQSLIDVFNNVSNKIDLLKEIIIRIKLDLFFKFIEEGEAVQKFKEVKEHLANSNAQFEQLKMKLVEKTNSFIEPELIQELESEISEFKKLFVLKESDEMSMRLKIEHYLVKILPLANKIREIKYKYNLIEDEKGNEVKNTTDLQVNTLLRQQAYSLQDLEVDL